MQLTVVNTTSILLELSAPAPDKRLLSENGTSTTRRKTRGHHCMMIFAVGKGQRPLQFDCVEGRYLRLATGLDSHEPYTIQLTVLRSVVSRSFSFSGFWISSPGSVIATERALDASSVRHRIVTLASLDDSSGLDKYPSLLASSLNVLSMGVPFRAQYLTDQCADTPADSTRPCVVAAERAQSLVRQLPLRKPTVLLLELGLLDLKAFMATNHSSHDMHHFLDDFISAYTGFIDDVRWRLRERLASHLESGVVSGLESSYEYNSAPSTLPIFVMTPFTSSRRLRRLLGHACSAVVRQQLEGGDISTHWVDTDGWLQKDDWVFGRKGDARLSPRAHMKVAAFISIHLCATLGFEGCPYHRPDAFLGKLYSPTEVDMERLLAERKLALIKEALRWS
jgi:hypothetical protein